MAEEKQEKEGEVAQETLMSLGGATSLGGGAEAPLPALTDEQIIACAVIGAKALPLSPASLPCGDIRHSDRAEEASWGKLLPNKLKLKNETADVY